LSRHHGNNKKNDADNKAYLLKSSYPKIRIVLRNFCNNVYKYSEISLNCA